MYEKLQECSMPSKLHPILAIVAGILVLIYPKILNYVVAIYLILFGILTLMNH